MYRSHNTYYVILGLKADLSLRFPPGETLLDILVAGAGHGGGPGMEHGCNRGVGIAFISQEQDMDAGQLAGRSGPLFEELLQLFTFIFSPISRQLHRGCAVVCRCSPPWRAA